MIKCDNCGRENPDNFNFCIDCGHDLQAQSARKPAGAGAAPAARPVAPRPIPLAAKPLAAAPKPIPVAPKPAGPAHVAPANLKPRPLSPAPVAPPGAGVAPTPAIRLPGAPGPAVAPPSAPAPAAGPMSKCPKCGTENPAGNTFCGNCGHRVHGAEGQPEEKKTMFMHAVSVPAERKLEGKLVTINPDGSEGMVYSLKGEETVAGRSQGIILFMDDKFVSPRHAKFTFRENKLYVLDEKSLNGVFVRLKGEAEIEPGTSIRVGKQLLRFTSIDHLEMLPEAREKKEDTLFFGGPDAGYWGRLDQVMEGGRIGDVHLLSGNEVLVGRSDGDILFPEDGFVSGRHAAFSRRDGPRFLVRDLGSSNGTFLRITKETELKQDDFLLIGNKLLRVEIR
jgi:pSer/pThr/pTyr-binding forkhead associated (FHA) protein